MKIAVRDGAQNVPAVCALVKVVPDLANVSMLGVRACSYPSGPTQSQRSSKAKKITLGRSVPDADAIPAVSSTAKSVTGTIRRGAILEIPG